MTAFYTARALSTARLQELVVQTAHGFIAGDVITFNSVTSNSWKLAQADSLVDCQGACMVSLVLDANTFIATQDGYISNIIDPSISPFTVGRQYYLSPTTPGHLTLTEPTTTGQVILPCFVSDTTTSGYFFGGSGEIIQAVTLFNWTTISASQTMAVNNGYFSSGSSTLNLALPTSAALGDLIRVANIQNGFTITCAGTQFIDFGIDNSGTGTGHGISSTAAGDTIEIVCATAGASTNNGWIVLSSQGNLTLF